MSKNYAVEVKNLYKDFKLPKEQSSGIKQAIINALKGIKGYEKQSVLKNISFNVEKGDFFGIVGRNGSGKSTLLKLISQIYTPDKGTIKVNGSLVPFIELGVGFNPELTGRENIFLNGALLGFSRNEMESMYDEIVNFAELERFMDQKLKNYSSGMQVRLAFSIAIKAKGDILVLDEVLAVGDEAFQKKCNEYFNSLKNSDKTVILVTHSMAAVKQFCNKAILISNGKIEKEGNPVDVSFEYSKMFIDQESKKKNDDVSANRYGSKDVIYKSILVTVKKNEVMIDAIVKNNTEKPINDLNVCMDFLDSNKTICSGINFYEHEGRWINLKPRQMKKIHFAIDNLFGYGIFTITAALKVENDIEMADCWKDAKKFSNTYSNNQYYSVIMPYKVVEE